MTRRTILIAAGLMLIAAIVVFSLGKAGRLSKTSMSIGAGEDNADPRLQKFVKVLDPVADDVFRSVLTLPPEE